MAGETIAREGKLASLDGWRAVAVGLVLLSHTPYTGANALLDDADWLSALGNLGVRIFFVLSGFLITYLLLVEEDRAGKIDLRNFYVRRVLRIFPVYYAFLLCLAVVQLTTSYRDEFSTWIGAVTFTRDFIGDGKGATLHLWSVAVEEQFYLVWPFALAGLGLGRRWRLAIACLAVVCVLSIGARWFGAQCDTSVDSCRRFFGQFSAFRYGDSLAIGCIAAILRVHKVVPPLDRNARTALMYTSAAALCVLFIVSWGPLQPAAFTAQAIVIAIAMICSVDATGSAPFRILNSWPFVQLGLLSYSLYIWHVLFLSEFTGFKGIVFDGRWWWVPAMVVAVISYYGFERPLLGLRRRFARA